MSDKVNERIQSYEKKLYFLQGQTQGQSPKLIDKKTFEEIEKLKDDLDEMKKDLGEFEASFIKKFPSLEKADEKEKIKSSTGNSTGCVIAILIAFIIIVLAFIAIVIVNQKV